MEDTKMYTLVLTREQLKLLYKDVDLYINTFDKVKSTPFYNLVEDAFTKEYPGYLAIRNALIKALLCD